MSVSIEGVKIDINELIYAEISPVVSEFNEITLRFKDGSEQILKFDDYYHAKKEYDFYVMMIYKNSKDEINCQ